MTIEEQNELKFIYKYLKDSGWSDKTTKYLYKLTQKKLKKLDLCTCCKKELVETAKGMCNECSKYW
jgi:hypothetical protein